MLHICHSTMTQGSKTFLWAVLQSNKGLWLLGTTQMDLGESLFCDISQTQEDRHCIIIFIDKELKRVKLVEAKDRTELIPWG